MSTKHNFEKSCRRSADLLMSGYEVRTEPDVTEAPGPSYISHIRDTGSYILALWSNIRLSKKAPIIGSREGTLKVSASTIKTWILTRTLDLLFSASVAPAIKRSIY
jgi:hypothetical protein